MTTTVTKVANQMLADAYDVWRAANLDIVQLTLRALAEEVREQYPDAKTIVFDWSDQGDFLNLSEIRNAAGADLNEDREFDTCGYDWNLGTDNASQWTEYMTDENGESFDVDRRWRDYHLDVDKALAIEIPERFRG